MSIERISSLQNPRIKNLVRLREASHRKRQNRFLIEGTREVSRAIQSKWPVESIFYCEDLFKEMEAFDLLEKLDFTDVELLPLTTEAFNKAAYRQNPDGILAVAHRRSSNLEDLVLPEVPLLLVLEGLEKPGNLGAIFRTANAAGCHAIIMSNPHADVFNPNTIRASQGAFFEQPFALCDNQSAKQFLLHNKIKAILTSPDAEDVFWNFDLQGPTAIVLGTEDEGLTNDWLMDDRFHKARFPMSGVTDSLNVSATAAIATFEALRQRSMT